GMDPMDHYMRIGHRLNRDPGPDFSVRFARTVYGLRPLFEPVSRLDWMRRKYAEEPKINHKRVLVAAADIARHDCAQKAIAIAEHHLPENLAHTAEILRANAAINKGDREGWLAHLNAYLAHFGANPLRISGSGPLFEGLTGAHLPPVTGGPLISVIMPAWNAENTIRKSVDSILGQSWQNIELLIVDDCSSDGTWSVLQDIAQADDRVKIMRNKVNVGPYVSKNIALKSAKGAWVTGQDADDWSLPDRLEKHVQTAESRGLDASLSYMIRMHKSGYFGHIGSLGSFCLDGAARKSSISCLLKKDVMMEKIGFWDTVRFGADSELIARATLVCGERFSGIRAISMICLDVETSLTNHPEHGVRKATGISPIRATYRDAWSAWLETKSAGDDVFLPFPQTVRRFSAPDEMNVPVSDIVANIATGGD
ncbi:MAG: glycosyltransferase, partial [Paracoccus sp. (in: a-proteobacteria)]|nr:glycosyltransferase [Paracoccus sp. (in: a-proteobacteria)]